MSYGLSILNQAGEVQIDSAFRNFQIVREGTTGTISPAGLGWTFNVLWSGVPTPPLFFARVNPTAGGYVNGLAALTLNRNASGLYDGITLMPYDFYGTQGSFTVDWFVAAPDNNVSGDTWGMQVFDAQAAKVFDSGARYMRISDVVVLPANIFSLSYTGSYVFSHAAVTNGFYCLNGVRNFRDQGSYVWVTTRRVTDSALEVGFIDTERCPVVPAGSYTARANHVIIAQKNP